MSKGTSDFKFVVCFWIICYINNIFTCLVESNLVRQKSAVQLYFSLHGKWGLNGGDSIKFVVLLSFGYSLPLVGNLNVSAIDVIRKLLLYKLPKLPSPSQPTYLLTYVPTLTHFCLSLVRLKDWISIFRSLNVRTT